MPIFTDEISFSCGSSVNSGILRMKIYNVGLFLLQRLSRVGPGGAKGLPEDGAQGD